jgi:DNA-directed RNA polymerase subunit omega
MIYPSADKIDKEVGSKYTLVALAAKRAKQLKEGASPLVQSRSANPLTIALEEIASGLIKFRFDETSLAGQEALAEKQAVIGRRDLEVEGVDPLAMPDDLRAAAVQLGADLTSEYLEEAETADEDLSEDEEIDEEEEDDPLLLDDETEGPEV